VHLAGSRSTPLVLTLARQPGLPTWSHVDERVAGFFALGVAKQSGRPAAVACTSGTAAAHYLPAVIEAHEARVPLIVLTTDRPPELRAVGAGQTIDQLKLYGDAAKWFFEVGTHSATPERLRWIRQLAFRAYQTAVSGRPGAVHLNFALREPLVLDEPLPATDDAPLPRSRRTAAPPAIDLDPASAPSSSPAATSATTAWARRWHGRPPRSGRRCWPIRSRAPAAVGAAVAHLRRAAARCGLRRRPSPAGRHPHRRPADLQAAAPVAGGLDARQVAFDPETAWQDPAPS
jgi:2-succinyl-5-enolpyruvyl-6-hydroxy-3-cyclohexene-1-carboxylate synthase